MKCIIIDDEPFAREGVRLNMKDVHFLENIGEFSNALEANNFLSEHDVDLMFLDIEMPGISGLDFLRMLKTKPLTILTTAYPQYALDGYELDVVDYLVKPIRLDRFIKAVNKAKDIYDLRHSPTAASTVESKETDYFYVKADRKFVKVYFRDLSLIKGMKDYVQLHVGDQKMLTAMNMKTINAQLPDHIFTRVSKSHIVNINHIETVDNDGIMLRNHDSENIPLGDTYREAFINNYIKTNLVQRK